MSSSPRTENQHSAFGEVKRRVLRDSQLVDEGAGFNVVINLLGDTIGNYGFDEGRVVFDE